MDKVVVESGANGSLEVFGNGTALLDEANGVLAFPGIDVGIVDDAEEVVEEGGIRLQVSDNVHLMKKDERVEDGEGRIIEDASQHHVLEILEPPGSMDLAADVFVFDGHDFLETRRILEILSMIGLVMWEILIVCKGQLRGAQLRGAPLRSTYTPAHQQHREPIRRSPPAQ